jgi:hypothetical protein
MSIFWVTFQRAEWRLGIILKDWSWIVEHESRQTQTRLFNSIPKSDCIKSLYSVETAFNG